MGKSRITTLNRVSLILLTSTGLMALLACSSSLPTTQFANPGFDFSYVQRVAVIPFANLSSDSQAGERATRLLITELLASGALDVVEPGEVQAAMRKMGSGRMTAPSSEEALGLGQALGVQAVVIGTVAQSEVMRFGSALRPVVTLDAQMIETDTGAIVWAATHTEKGSTVGARLLGTGGEPLAETTRRCIQKLLDTLLD
ncbi:MAG: penicillin-binding protein activator LpoB [Thermoanaerobaculia bacterium]